MTYQNSGYQNVATNEDEILNNPASNQEDQFTQQTSYHNGPMQSNSNALPTYHQYMYSQQGSYDEFPGMGFYGPNVGELGDYTRRVRRNRRIIGFFVAAIILIVLLPHHTRHSSNTKYSTNTVDSPGNISPGDVGVDSHHSGIA